MSTEYVKTIECPKCRYRNVAGTKFCGDCGTALGGSPVPCGKCGKENPPDTKFCGNCGNNLANPQENDPDVRHLQEALKGKYVVQKPLGEGGFGRVFLAEHIGLKQNHVIKLLSADSSRSTDIRSRFFQEAQVLAKLKHPNIVPIMDVAEFGGRPYYIMSYLNGGCLADLLRKEKSFSVEKSLSYIQKLLSALSVVHAKGIIHRDIKPDNVLLDEEGEPILIDFGIARVEEGGKAKTGTGFSIGTPQYMSPEQLEGKSISQTTDIYSMGIMLFELLTGKPPYEGSFLSIANQHNAGNLPSLGEKIGETPLAKEIQGLLEKACSKEPSARYSSAKEMRDALETVLRKPKDIPIETGLQKPAPETVTQTQDIETKPSTENTGKEKLKWYQSRKIFVGVLGLTLLVLAYFSKDFLFLEDELVVPIPSGKTYTNSIGMEFIEISAGEFMMGCSKGDTECADDEKPRHKVRITKPFYLGKFEVTQGQWMAVMGENPSYFENCGKNCPIDNVNWNDVKNFIKKLCIKEKMNYCKYRLSTEAEWEYAARAGTNTMYYWGNEINYEATWYVGNSNESPHPVGLRTPNNWGLYDMIGNLWEWTDDDYDFYKDDSQIDPKVLLYISNNRKVIRGGSSFYCTSPCTPSVRWSDPPALSAENQGFRLVMQP